MTAAAVGSRSQCSNPISEDFGPKTCPSGTFGHYFLSGKSSSGLLRGAKMGIWGKIWAFGSKYWYLGQNIGYLDQNIGYLGQNIGYLGQDIGYLGQNIGIWVKIWDICLMSGPLYWIQPLC